MFSWSARPRKYEVKFRWRLEQQLRHERWPGIFVQHRYALSGQSRAGNLKRKITWRYKPKVGPSHAASYQSLAKHMAS
jgi:hypothetical protein